MQVKDHTTKIKYRLFFGRVLLCLLAVAFIVGVAVFTVRNINVSLYKERTTNINLLMGRIALNIEDSLQQQWNHAEYFKNDFAEHDPDTIEKVLHYLKAVESKTSLNIKSIYVIDENARCYRSDGKNYRWKDNSVLLSDQKVCSISTEEFQISNEDTHMLFVVPFETPLIVEDKAITHLAIAVDMGFIETFFEIKDFGEHSVSFIISPDGTQVYGTDKDNPLSGVFNLLTALERDANFRYDGSIDSLKQDIASRNSGCVFLRYGDKEYFLAYEPLSTNNWTSLLLVEADTFSSGAGSMAASIIASMSILAVVSAAIIIIIILSLTRSTNKKLKQAAEAERKANQAKTTFLSSMSHDIRTPMNAIVGMTNLAMAHMDNPSYVQACLAKVKLSSDHLLTLINDVLDISKVESGQTILVSSTFSLSREMEKLSEIVAPQVEEKHQIFELCTQELTVNYLYADQVRLSQIMVNLLSNAVKYTPNGGHIRVTLASKVLEAMPDIARVVYTVEDNGIGMSKEFQRTMYDSFARENNAPQNKIQGSGLGLSICKQIVDLMGGTIECQSEVGKGTVFTVTVDVPMAVVPSEGLEQSVSTDYIGSLEGLKILVAEDNDFNWEISHELLKMSGIETVRAVNGKECFDMISSAEENAYDLILMDIQMPIMNGYESAKEIRVSRREYLKKIPIIAVTADAFSEDIQRCLDAGMDAHVSKPIDSQKLLEVIRKLKLSKFQNGEKRI